MLGILAEAQISGTRLLEAAAGGEFDIGALKDATQLFGEFGSLHRSPHFAASAFFSWRFAGSTFIALRISSVTSSFSLAKASIVESAMRS